MTTPVKRAAVELQDAVFDNAYYVDVYLATLGKHRMSTASIDQYEFSEPRLIAMWKDFRVALPNSEMIRRKPFQLLAELVHRHRHTASERP